MSGKNNQRRGKQQEYRLKDALEKMDDVEIIKYYGQREGKAGDFLVRVGKHQVRFDHKSTSNDTLIRLKKDWMVKLTGINLMRMDAEGAAIPCISFSILGKRGIYVMCRQVWNTNDVFDIVTNFHSVPMTGGMLNDYDCIQVFFDGYQVYVYKLEYLIERIKNDG